MTQQDMKKECVKQSHERYPKGQEEIWYKHLIDTDYAAIDGITKEAAQTFHEEICRRL